MSWLSSRGPKKAAAALRSEIPASLWCVTVNWSSRLSTGLVSRGSNPTKPSSLSFCASCRVGKLPAPRSFRGINWGEVSTLNTCRRIRAGSEEELFFPVPWRILRQRVNMDAGHRKELVASQLTSQLLSQTPTVNFPFGELAEEAGPSLAFDWISCNSWFAKTKPRLCEFEFRLETSKLVDVASSFPLAPSSSLITIKIVSTYGGTSLTWREDCQLVAPRLHLP